MWCPPLDGPTLLREWPVVGGEHCRRWWRWCAKCGRSCPLFAPAPNSLGRKRATTWRCWWPRCGGGWTSIGELLFVICCPMYLLPYVLVALCIDLLTDHPLSRHRGVKDWDVENPASIRMVGGHGRICSLVLNIFRRCLHSGAVGLALLFHRGGEDDDDDEGGEEEEEEEEGGGKEEVCRRVGSLVSKMGEAMPFNAFLPHPLQLPRSAIGQVLADMVEHAVAMVGGGGTGGGAGGGTGGGAGGGARERRKTAVWVLQAICGESFCFVCLFGPICPICPIYRPSD
jgi:hypothetical protein